MSLLALTAVTKRFGGVEAVSELTLNAESGAITGLIGPNGAGKSTIINLITGMLKVSSGSIQMRGTDLTRLAPNAIATAGIARTFQNIRLLHEASVIDNVVIGFHRNESTSIVSNLLGLPSAVREKKLLYQQAGAMLADFSMQDLCLRPAGSLSYGHQRRLEIVRALASSPDLLLLDEPVAGMNDVEAQALGEILQRLAQRGIAILLVEHNIPFVTALCETLYVVNAGKVIAAGDPEAVCADPQVITAYLGE